MLFIEGSENLITLIFEQEILNYCIKEVTMSSCEIQLCEVLDYELCYSLILPQNRFRFCNKNKTISTSLSFSLFVDTPFQYDILFQMHPRFNLNIDKLFLSRLL